MHVATVLKILRLAGLTLKLSKSLFFYKTVNYLGHIAHPDKLVVATRTINGTKMEQHPTTETEMRSFIGVCNVYRRFVPKFAGIASPLNHKPTKGQPHELDSYYPEE